MPEDPDQGAAYLGGNPYLPESIPWPTDSTGAPLLHLASLPASVINRYLAGMQLNDELVVSLFTPYSSVSDSYIDQAMQEGGKVLAYRPAARQVDGYGQPITPARRIAVVENPGQDNRAAPGHKGILVGGTGYLLLKQGIDDEDLMAGALIIQSS
ncbi:MAG: DUF1963 domain-containing protein [Candidatus Pseudomonas colombiensis]|nr:MAG: DUF1963 domain-containing protein [Pseudomonas sp.]